MKSFLRGSVAISTLLACAASASGGPLYASMFGGANWGNDLDAASGGGGIVNASRTVQVTHQTPAPHPHTLAFVFTAVTDYAMSGASADTGFVIGATVGREYDNLMPGLRLELEGSFRRNKFGLATISGGGSDSDTASSIFDAGGNINYPAGVTPLAPLVPVGPGVASAPSAGVYSFAADFATNFTLSDVGSVQTWSLMANAWWDLSNSSDITPYVGGGIGYAVSKFDGGAVYDGVDGNFAWQLGAGVNYKVSEETQLGVGYRYFDAGDVTLSLPTASGTRSSMSQDVKSSSVMLQITHQFN